MSDIKPRCPTAPECDLAYVGHYPNPVDNYQCRNCGEWFPAREVKRIAKEQDNG